MLGHRSKAQNESQENTTRNQISSVLKIVQRCCITGASPIDNIGLLFMVTLLRGPDKDAINVIDVIAGWKRKRGKKSVTRTSMTTKTTFAIQIVYMTLAGPMLFHRK